MNLGHLDFDIVSDFDIRISDFASLGIFTLVKNPLQIAPFMQNKPNFRKAKMNVTYYITKNYENVPLCRRGENKPNQTQSPLNFDIKINTTTTKKIPIFSKTRIISILFTICDYLIKNCFCDVVECAAGLAVGVIGENG
ncbi:MAG: hypothetical protein ACYS30_16580, partial [Planctomycetota bacterium]